MAEFEQSNLSQKDFCEPRGINPAYFSQRRLELQRDAEDNHAGFALAVSQSPATQQTLQLRLGRTELVLPLSVSPRWVAQLVKELSA
ncbi:IS66 family insertion sequence element accessory protein TnpA [Idiomarina aquatica]|uniref:IS66 family insertion sequence element accessory protein TnpA n=1 Tax=Idiomarina aquatica TaxID=1327752 RepID=UPI003D768161